MTETCTCGCCEGIDILTRHLRERRGSNPGGCRAGKITAPRTGCLQLQVAPCIKGIEAGHQLVHFSLCSGEGVCIKQAQTALIRPQVYRVCTHEVAAGGFAGICTVGQRCNGQGILWVPVKPEPAGQDGFKTGTLAGYRLAAGQQAIQCRRAWLQIIGYRGIGLRTAESRKQQYQMLAG